MIALAITGAIALAIAIAAAVALHARRIARLMPDPYEDLADWSELTRPVGHETSEEADR